MLNDAALFVSLASIAGIFVGFGSLIGFTRRGEIDRGELVQFRAVVTIGLMTIVAALVPVLLARYGLSGRLLWLTCGAGFLLLSWVVTVLALRDAEQRAIAKSFSRSRPATAALLWVGLEVPIQVSLILIVLGVFEGLEPALYATALVLHVFEAAFVLAQLVYSEATPPAAS